MKNGGVRSFWSYSDCLIFVDKEYLRSVQNSPEYPAAQTHFPSTHDPPFIHIALQDFPSLPEDYIKWKYIKLLPNIENDW